MELNVRFGKFLPLLLIVLAFASPMLMAHIALIFQDNIKQSTNSYGRLLTEPKKVTINKFEKLLATESTQAHKWQIVFVTATSCDPDCLARKDSLIRLHTLLRDDKERVEVISALATDIEPHQAAGEIMLLDPQGNHIMDYQKTAEPSGILKDLMRLLKYSNV